MKQIFRFGFGLVLAGFVSPLFGFSDQEQEQQTQISSPTHKQIRSIQTKHDGKLISLNTFCLAPNGDILACVGGARVYVQRDAAGPSRQTFVQVYSPEGILKSEWPIEFRPTAINVARDETVFVAGEGKVARYSLQGKLLASAKAPNLADEEKFREEAIARAKEQNERSLSLMRQQVKRYEEQIAKLEEIPEDERTVSQQAQLKAYTRILEPLRTRIKSLEKGSDSVRVESLLAAAKTISGLSVSDQYLFLSCRNVSGYDVWRCDFDFQNAERVLSGLRGCCGQMDIQAAGDRLLVAENTKFRVGVYDTNGKTLDHFGSRDRTGKEGFGSCCNPMNIRCCSNGDILTAESSVGHIKRFSADGTFQAYIGKAKISAGCKHVAVAWDEQRDRYYIMNVDQNSICVLVPLSEAPEFTEEELLAKKAREGLGQQLVGTWKVSKEKADPISNALRIFGGRSPSSRSVYFEQATFDKDGSLKISGGLYGNLSAQEWRWGALRQNTKEQQLEIEVLADGIQYFTAQVTFLSETKARFSVIRFGRTVSGALYQRVTSSEPADPKDGTEEKAVSAQRKPESSVPAAAADSSQGSED